MFQRIYKQLILMIISILIVLSSAYMCFADSPKGASSEMTGTYKNTKYKTSGLYNENGELVQGINYSPTASFGWWGTVVQKSYYSDTSVRKDLSNIKKLGYNSIRVLSPFTDTILNGSSFKEILKEYKESYVSLLKACRDYGLSADLSILDKTCWNSNYETKNSAAYQVLKDFVMELESEFDDVIVLWELANEPDPNTWGFTLEESIEMFETDAEWNEKVKPFLTWEAKALKEMGVKNPISIGAMNAQRCDSWDALNTDVANIHNYRSTVSDVDAFNSEMWQMDMNTLGYCRPTVLSEVGMPNGMCQPNSDIIQYCIENDIAYYVWGYAYVSNEGYMQGLVDNTGALRTGTMNYSSLQNYSNNMSLTVPSYDNVVGGNDSSKNAFWFLNLGLKDKTDLEAYSFGAEMYYNWVRGQLPYWTPDFREAFYMAEGKTFAERYDYIVTQASNAIIPYIRTYGNYQNDNLLGGKATVEYSEKFLNDNFYTDVSYKIGRSKYAFGCGKDGSDAILMQQKNQLIIKEKLNHSTAYSMAVDLKIADDSYSGLGLFCGDDSSETDNPGVYLRVTQNRSDDYKKNGAVTQSPYTVNAYYYHSSGANTKMASFDYSPDLVDDGFVNLKVVFGGQGTIENPLNVDVYIGNEKIGDFAITRGFGADAVYTSLITTYTNAANYFDNLILKNEKKDEIILSDSFDTGKFDGDYLTYTPYSTTNTNVSILDKIALILSDMDKSTVLAATPKNVTASICDSLLVMKWDYSGKGESGFEIQRSIDGENWQRMWRTLPGNKYAIIPLYENDADNYMYRVSPIASSNSANKFCEAITPNKGNGKDGNYYAEFESNGKKYKVIAIGSGFYLDGHGSNCTEEVSQEFYSKRFAIKTNSFDARLDNPKMTAKNTTFNDNNKTSILSTVLFAISAVLLVASTCFFGMTFLKRRKNHDN